MVSAIERSEEVRRANVVHSMSVAIFALSAGCVASPVEPIDSAAGDAAAIEIPAAAIHGATSVETGESIGEAQEELPVFVNFKRSEFPFITTVEDDGTGPAGGWQVARAKLDFSYVLFPTRIKRWQCPLGVEMPIRTETKGRFSPRRAADLAAKIANDVGRRIDYKLPQRIFCDKFISEMQKLAESPQYRGTGVQVKH